MSEEKQKHLCASCEREMKPHRYFSTPEKSVCDECLRELRTEHEADLFEKCPFCGENDMEYIISVPYLYGAEGIRVRCKNCGASSGYGDIRRRTSWDLSTPPIFNHETIEDGFKSAREKWNGRASNHLVEMIGRKEQT